MGSRIIFSLKKDIFKKAHSTAKYCAGEPLDAPAGGSRTFDPQGREYGAVASYDCGPHRRFLKSFFKKIHLRETLVLFG